jgi:hypothetical protein
MPGISADLDLGPIEIMAGVRAELSTLNAHNAARDERRKRELARTRVPVDARLITVGTCPAGGADFVLSVSGPDPGYYWLVQRLVIGGLLFDTTAAGDAEIYVTGLSFGSGGSVGPQVAALGLSDLVDRAPSLPNIAFYSPHQIIVLAQENLAALIGGGTAAQQYVMAAQVQVFRTIAAGEQFNA